MLPTRKNQWNHLPRSLHNEYSSLQNQINSIFDDFLGDWGEILPRRWEKEMKNFSPAIDVKESDKAYVLTAEMPGMKESDIDLSFEDNTLFIKGEKKTEEEEKSEDKKYYRKERTHGQFMQAVPFSKEIEMEKVTAEMKNGLLTVNLPKLAQSPLSKKKISIKPH